MKKIICILGLLSAFYCNAADWFPVGAQWYWGHVYDCCGPPPHADYYYTWNSVKDTVIQNKHCSVIEEYSELQLTNRFIYFDSNNVVTRFINNKFLPVCDFNRHAGDTSVFVTDSGNNSCDSFLFVIDSVKPLLQDASLRVQYGHVIFHENCWGGSYIPLNIIEKVGSSYLNTKFYFVLVDGGYDYIRCYSDYEVDLHFNSAPCDTIVLQGYERLRNISGVKIYPNPVDEKLELDFATSLKITGQITIINNIGDVIYTKKLNNSSHENINVHDLPAGVYLLKLINGDEIISRTFIVHH